MAGLERRTVLKGLLASGAAAGAGAFFYGYADERLDIQVVRSQWPLADLPPALAGLRVGLITDLHHGEQVSVEQVRRAAALLLAEAPDLIVLGGDYINRGEFQFAEPCAEALSALEAPHGVFAILGNHDDDRHVPAALRRRQFEVLSDARTERTIRGERVAIAGIRFWTWGRGSVGRAVGPSPHRTVLLAHDPRRLVEAADLGVAGVLSGHTHGGQIVLPLLGSPIARQYPVLQGLAYRQETTLFVSRGVGTVLIPLRLNCPPDVSVLTLASRPTV
jgi:predicted MPP superfamily phosphohydrolase